MNIPDSLVFTMQLKFTISLKNFIPPRFSPLYPIPAPLSEINNQLFFLQTPPITAKKKKSLIIHFS